MEAKSPNVRVGILISFSPQDLGVHGGAHGADDGRGIVRLDHARTGYDHVCSGLKRHLKAIYHKLINLCKILHVIESCS